MIRWRITFEYRALVPKRPDPCRKVTLVVVKESVREAEFYARTRFILPEKDWTLAEVKRL